MGAFLARAVQLPPALAVPLGEAWDEAWHAEGSPGPAALARAVTAAAAAGRDWDGTRKAAWRIPVVQRWPVSGYTVRRALSDAAGAGLTRDLISDADYATLSGPWELVTGEAA